MIPKYGTIKLRRFTNVRQQGSNRKKDTLRTYTHRDKDGWGTLVNIASSPKTVQLKNGTFELEYLVKYATGLLQELAQARPMDWLDLVMMCRDSNYHYPASARQGAEAVGLIQPHQEGVHESTKNVVLSSAKGEGINMVFVSPLVEQEEQAE